MKRVDVAYGIIFNLDKTKVLAVRNRKDNSWTLPGGKRENGETFKNAVIREVWEETGLNVEVSSICSMDERIHDNQHDVFVNFYCTSKTRDIKINDNGILEVKWMSLDETVSHFHWLPCSLKKLTETSGAVYF